MINNNNFNTLTTKNSNKFEKFDKIKKYKKKIEYTIRKPEKIIVLWVSIQQFIPKIHTLQSKSI